MRAASVAVATDQCTVPKDRVGVAVLGGFRAAQLRRTRVERWQHEHGGADQPRQRNLEAVADAVARAGRSQKDT